VFTINGKGADQDDFGDMHDHDAESAEPYACADMHFDPKPPTKEVLDEYNLTEGEYYNICNELECKLCVGSCVFGGTDTSSALFSNKEVDIGDYSDWEMIDGKHYCPDCYEVEVIDGVYNVKAKEK
jgi:hypothetical protein